MRKLFALLLVSVLCGAANAAVISFAQEGEPVVVCQGESINLYIRSSAPLFLLDVIVNVVWGDAIITGAMTPSDAAAYGWDPALCSAPIFYSPKAVEINGAAWNNNYTPVVGYVTVQCGQSLSVITLSPGYNFGGSLDANLQEATISPGPVWMPEPGTIALLALGGLFIRRRK